MNIMQANNAKLITTVLSVYSLLPIFHPPYLIWTPIEYPILQMLNITKVVVPCLKNTNTRDSQTLFNLNFDIKYPTPLINMTAIRSTNIILKLFRKVFRMPRQSSNFMVAVLFSIVWRLQPFVAFSRDRGAMQTSRYSQEPSAKQASWRTPNSYNPTILQDIIEMKSSTQLITSAPCTIFLTRSSIQHSSGVYSILGTLESQTIVLRSLDPRYTVMVSLLPTSRWQSAWIFIFLPSGVVQAYLTSIPYVAEQISDIEHETGNYFVTEIEITIELHNYF